MTIEKAMKILRAVDGIECRFPGYTTALGIAMFALEKQLPKKVKREFATEGGCITCFETTICPACGEDFEETGDYDFCPDCGQALDWSDENE